jgi:hypothetical protein
MAKWKRKKYEGQGTSSTLEGEEMSPLGTCLLERFANGMSASCLHMNICMCFGSCESRMHNTKQLL